MSAVELFVAILLTAFAAPALLLIGIVLVAPKTPAGQRNRPPFRFPTAPPSERNA